MTRRSLGAVVQAATVTWLGFVLWLGVSDPRLGFVAIFGPGFMLVFAMALVAAAAAAWYRPSVTRIGGVLQWLVAVIAINMIIQMVTVSDRGLTLSQQILVSMVAVIGVGLGVAGSRVLWPDAAN